MKSFVIPFIVVSALAVHAAFATDSPQGPAPYPSVSASTSDYAPQATSSHRAVSNRTGARTTTTTTKDGVRITVELTGSARERGVDIHVDGSGAKVAPASDPAQDRYQNTSSGSDYNSDRDADRRDYRDAPAYQGAYQGAQAYQPATAGRGMPVPGRLYASQLYGSQPAYAGAGYPPPPAPVYQGGGYQGGAYQSGYGAPTGYGNGYSAGNGSSGYPSQPYYQGPGMSQQQMHYQGDRFASHRYSMTRH